MEMFTADYKQVTYVPTSAVTAKSWDVIGGLLGWHFADAAADKQVSFIYECHWLGGAPKATGAEWALFDKLYWDNTNERFTKTSASNRFAGYARETAASGATTGTIIFLGDVA